MKRPKRARIAAGSVDTSTYLTNDGVVPGDGWVCADGGWHSIQITQRCDEYCHCSAEGRRALEELRREYEENRNVP